MAHHREGGSRTESQRSAGLTANSFRIWRKRFNEEGIEGLRGRPPSGRPKKLSGEREQALRE